MPAEFTSAAQAQPAPAGKYDTLLAPIALYPDALVMQIFQCSIGAGSDREAQTIGSRITPM
jgi:hypothetical protein